MTHNDAGSLIASLVEMAKATERLPQVERDLDNALKTINHLNDAIQRLELKLIDRNNTINDLGVQIHTLEVARDDAELRFLEADDCKVTLERTLEGLGRDIASVLEAVRPIPTPKPESVVRVEVTPVPFAEGATSPPDASSHDGTDEGVSVPADPTAPTDGHSLESDASIVIQTVTDTYDEYHFPDYDNMYKF